jgi:anthranilate/para-aminobenzoate synthase component II
MILIVDNTQDSPTALYLPKLIAVLHERDIPYITVTTYTELKDALQRYRRSIKGVIMSGSQLMISQMKHSEYIDIFTMNLVAVTMCGMKWRIPVLGICFGCQFIYTFFGGSLRKLPKPTCKNHMIHFVRPGESAPARFCCTYLLGENVPNDITIKAHVHNNEVGSAPCYIQHRSYPIYGTSFHPEYKKETHQILHKFLDITQCRTQGHT